MRKASKGLFPPIVTELFEKKNEHRYKLRYNSQFTIHAMNSVDHETVSVSFLDPKIWNLLPDRLKEIDSLGALKTAI